MVYILIAILIFGVLIAVHELGHFLAAKACGVRVNEFSIGMGPQLFHKTKGDTEYSLRLLPIGGYCAMEGEDEDSDDDRALGRQVWWKKFIIFVAGAFMNFLTGLIIVICLYAGAQAFYTTEIVELNPDFPQQGEDGLMPGDTIYAINGERIYLKSDVSLIMGLVDTGTIDMTVLRDGKKLDRTLTKQVYTDENGQEYEAYGFTYGGTVEATPLLRLQYSWYQTMDYVRIVRLSLQMLLSGAAGVNDLSGPVGIVSTITEVGKETEAEAAAKAEAEPEVAKPEKQFGVVAVSAGEGMANLFRELGVDRVVTGGQTMNPSTEDILTEVNKTPAEVVFVLPNNKNIIMAAQQCIPLSDKKVIVIPTKTVPQGITAMLSFDPASAEDVIEAEMSAAIESVHTAQITYAARDSDFDGHNIRKGEYLALMDGALLGSDADLDKVLTKIADAANDLDPEIVSIYYGEDVQGDAAQHAADLLGERLPMADVNVVNGGQPVYYYMISFE